MTLAASILNAPHIGVRELKNHLSQKLRTLKPIVVTEHGRPKRVILPYEVMVEIAETLEEMEDKALAGLVKLSRRARQEGVKPVSVTDLFKKLKFQKKKP